MKWFIRQTAFVLLAVMALSVFSACGTPAPSGMYAPADGENYRQGVENIIFALPEEYTVTMSANVLAGKGSQGDSFSVQCRHSDYVYGDLKKNYGELKAQLTGLYGDYEETLTEGKTVAEQEALEARYSLTISDVTNRYVQYLFYNEKSFYLFTYTAASDAVDEDLLSKVLATVSFDKENFVAPDGYKAVENATVDAVSSDRYLLFCPDEWILDTSLGMICMRVPSSTILSNISFTGTEVKDLAAFADGYAEKYAKEADISGVTSLEKYILASAYRMFGNLKDYTLVTTTGDEKVTAENLAARKDSFIVREENDAKLSYSYIDFTASLSAANAHGSGSLFLEYEENDTTKTELQTYKFRQYYLYANGYLYLFTYTATEDRFEEQLSDAGKVVKNFELVEEK